MFVDYTLTYGTSTLPRFPILLSFPRTPESHDPYLIFSIFKKKIEREREGRIYMVQQEWINSMDTLCDGLKARCTLNDWREGRRSPGPARRRGGGSDRSAAVPAKR